MSLLFSVVFFILSDVTEYKESFGLLCCLGFRACSLNSCFPQAKKNCCVASGCQVQWSNRLSLRKTWSLPRFPLTVTSVACEGRQSGRKRENICMGICARNILTSAVWSTGKTVDSRCRPLETDEGSGLGLFTVASTCRGCFRKMRTLSPIAKRRGWEGGEQWLCFSSSLSGSLPFS